MDLPADSNNQLTLEKTTHIPIAQLTPLLAAASIRSIKAIVTLTWPYSSATGSVAFLLAEPDFRLRRTRGQVRVQFAGSSAKRVAKSGIASGDEVVLCLDGVEWIAEENNVSTPGRGVDFELKFTERLLLQFRPEDSQDSHIIDLDHPEPEPEAAQTITPPIEPPASPIPTPITNGTTASVQTNGDLNAGEFASPAFLKRARASYGSLLEGIDLFAEEDGTVPGKGRKRTRLSTQWRLTTGSPSPEPEESPEPEPEASAIPAEKSRPIMTDEGCQTVELEVDDAAEALASFSRQAVNVGSTPYARSEKSPNEEVQTQSTVTFEAQPPTMFETQPPTTFEAQPSVTFEAQPSVTFETPMPPPMIQTFLSSEEAQSSDIPEPPSSPRLQPQRSESLPLVSPLVSKSLFGFSEPVPAPIPIQGLFGTTRLPESADSLLEPAENMDEDLYSASPKRNTEAFASDLSTFQGPFDDVGSIPAELQEQFGSENQYGHWQNDNANISYASSPHKQQDPVDDMVEDEHFYAEENHEARHLSPEDGSSYHDMPPSQHQYPDMDEMNGQDLMSTWGGHSAVAYPELPEPDDGTRYDSSMNPPPPQSAPMSRSTSGQSQKQAIDLTESSDEQDEDEDEDLEEHEKQGEISREGSDAEAYDESENDDEPQNIPSQYLSRENLRRPQKQPDERYYEDEFEEEDDDNGVHASRGDYYDGEEGESEGSYDEEDMEEEEGQEPVRAAPQGTPEVIDLLSSDEEDAGDIPAPKEPIPRTQATSAEGEDSEEEESGESDGDQHMDDDQGTRNAEGSVSKQMSAEAAREGPYESSDGEESDFEEDEVDQDTRMTRNEQESDDGEASHGSESESEAGPEPDVPLESEPEVAVGIHKDDIAGNQDYVSFGDEEANAVANDYPDEKSSDFKGRRSSRYFGLDGSSEEEYPVDASAEDDQASTELDTQQSEHKRQLPTPNDTQKTGTTFTPNTSFSASQDPQIMTNASQTILKEILVPTTEVSDLASISEEAKTMVKDIPKVEVALPEAEPTSNHEDVTPHEEVLAESVEDVVTEDAQAIPLEESPEDSDEDIVTEEAVFEEIVEKAVEDTLMEDLPVTEEVIFEEIVEKAVEDTLMEESSESVPVVELPASSVNEEAVDDSVVEEATESQSFSEEPLNEVTENPDSVKETILDVKQPSEEPALVSPRRSSRLVKPEGLDKKENVPPSTPLKAAKNVQPSSARSDRSLPIVVIDELRSSPHGHDASVELALASHDSPAKKRHHTRKTSTASIEAPTKHHNLRNTSVEVTPPAISHNLRSASTEAAVLKPKPHNLRNAPLTETKAPSKPHNLRSTSTEETTSHTKPHNLRNAPTVEAAPPSKAHNLRNTDPKPQNRRNSTAEIESPPKHDLRKSTDPDSAKKQHDLRKPSAVDLKLQLSRTLRTKLSEFTALKVLRYHLGNKVDVLAVATTTPSEPERGKGTSRQYLTVFNITDVSIAPSGVTEVQVLRPYKDALPVIQAGDGVLLRNFTIVSVKNRGFGLRSEETSSWAVFKGDEEPEIRGPPVEFAAEESKHISLLKQWYEDLDATMMAKLNRANADKASA